MPLDISKPADLTFMTHDHPEAQGRIPRFGERAYEVRLMLEDGRTIVILIGQRNYDALADMLRQMAGEAILDNVQQKVRCSMPLDRNKLIEYLVAAHHTHCCTCPQFREAAQRDTMEALVYEYVLQYGEKTHDEEARLRTGDVEALALDIAKTKGHTL